MATKLSPNMIAVMNTLVTEGMSSPNVHSRAQQGIHGLRARNLISFTETGGEWYCGHWFAQGFWTLTSLGYDTAEGLGLLNYFTD